MDEMKKVWGFGIPQFDEEDILEGMELQSLCTQEAAKSITEDGLEVEQICADGMPTYIIASKDGKKYAIIVAGDATPNEGKVSVILKKRFADSCKAQGFIPMFAPVSLCSSDMARMNEGLLLKGDDFFFKYDGIVELADMKEPVVGDDSYNGYVMELLIDAYRANCFDNIYSRISDRCEFYAMDSNNPVKGRDEVCEYLEGLAKKNEKSGVTYDGTVGVITGKTSKCADIGKRCAVLMKQNGQQVSWIIADTDIDEDGKISSIKLADSAQFEFSTYYTFE